MALDFDDEILQDFLVEAGEIIEQLQAQLVELEQNPTDKDLLNAIFRGFHTVKGGAGFLSLNPMVDTCHGAENLFDLLRNGQLAVSSELMDVVLQALDEVNDMFICIQSGQEPNLANQELVGLMARIAAGEPIGATPATPEAMIATAIENEQIPTSPEPPTASNGSDIDSLNSEEYQHMLSALGGDSQSDNDDISDDEFESLLDSLHGKGQFQAPDSNATTITANSDIDIKADEFESLLDELHGKDQFGTVATEETGATSSDDISDDEFESLLDELHGKGQFSVDPDISGNADSPSSELIDDDEFEQLLDNLHGADDAPTPETPSVPKVTTPQASAMPSPKPEQGVSASLASAASTAEKIAAASPITTTKVAPAAKKPASNMPQAETTVRVDTARLDEIMNMVGELVLVRNRLLTLGVERDDEEMSKALASLDMVTGDLQGGVMKTRMQPIKKVFGRFPRVVRDLARSLKKEIVLELEGEETDLDKNLVEALADPLVHLVRNSIDHGIEMPNEREAAGKTRQGTILLSAAQEGDHILLCIRDDGGGMNANKLKQIAIDRGVLDTDAANRMSDKDAYNLIFAPGFSTKQEISDISGRGVGMDVVKTRITQLNGSVEVDSAPGIGTLVEIKVPLTLAIMPTLMVRVSEQVFALPLSCVSEIFHMELANTNVVDGQLSITVRERAIPLFYLDKWLCKGPGREERIGNGHVVIVHIGTTLVGFVVDALIGQEEVVIKPLGTMLQNVPGMAGSTITSNGGIALILDVPGMLKHYARRR
ncbi:chemotaxis protein CheA [Ferrimonas lipolytica]|uniref:Chemotaxis protein CheA n=1 Tax=Ferrimonas lipolytica TaxID=2724191 RepID=A0A6H1UFD5_9GAMM|nr:chemotaxis protein CheA [Ferrimonas lipolytica]QIZ77339.1 chemotaxis protein CheA [Ferrimonas lipolytica]